MKNLATPLPKPLIDVLVMSYYFQRPTQLVRYNTRKKGFEQLASISLSLGSIHHILKSQISYDTVLLDSIVFHRKVFPSWAHLSNILGPRFVRTKSTLLVIVRPIFHVSNHQVKTTIIQFIQWSCTVTNVVSGTVKFSNPCGIDQYRIVCNQYHMVYLIFQCVYSRIEKFYIGKNAVLTANRGRILNEYYVHITM